MAGPFRNFCYCNCGKCFSTLRAFKKHKKTCAYEWLVKAAKAVYEADDVWTKDRTKKQRAARQKRDDDLGAALAATREQEKEKKKR